MKNQKPNKPHQVRIIGGQFKRRQVSFIETDGLRPTPDRLRETIFNWLMADIHGARVLDACAGSGVLGFEALSRGARHATLIEPHPAQAKLLAQSAKTLKLDLSTHTIINDSAQNALPSLHGAFDVIFLDPPYALNLWQPLLTILTKHALYHKDSLIYTESDKPIDFEGFELIKSTKVGQVYAGILAKADLHCTAF